jgi:hypothetical protein
MADMTEPDHAFDTLSLLTAEGRARSLGSLRSIVSQFFGVPGLIGLHGGLPPPHLFPITSLSFNLSGHEASVQVQGSQVGGLCSQHTRARTTPSPQCMATPLRALFTPPLMPTACIIKFAPIPPRSWSRPSSSTWKCLGCRRCVSGCAHMYSNCTPLRPPTPSSSPTAPRTAWR